MSRTESKRNLVRQVIALKDENGNVTGTKAVFHPKPTHGPQFRNYKEVWNAINRQPKFNSKRQTKLREEREKQLANA